jgi:hypothetical protein
LAFAFQQTEIFLAADCLSDAELTHCHTSLDWIEARKSEPITLLDNCRASRCRDERGAKRLSNERGADRISRRPIGGESTMRLATIAAVGAVGATLIAAPLAPARAWCGPICVAGAAVVGAATIATLPLAAAAAVVTPYYAPPAYYPPTPAYYPAPAYVAPAPAYYPYSGPVVAYGYYGPYYGPRWHRAHVVVRPHGWYYNH